MKTLGNILWFFLIGIWSAIENLTIAVLCFISLLFIPVGFQYVKLALFFLWPMGKRVAKVDNSGFKAVVNIIWCVLFGWEYYLVNVLFGALLCLTIIGIPFGLQYFKIAVFCALPLGHDFVTDAAK